MSAFNLGQYGFDKDTGSYTYIVPELDDRSVSDLFNLEVEGLEVLHSNGRTEVRGGDEYVVTISKNSEGAYSNLEVLDRINIPFASTICGFSDTGSRFFPGDPERLSACIQPCVDVNLFLENAERCLENFRYFGLQAASYGYRIDMNPRNFGIIDGRMVYHDVDDASAVVESDSQMREMAVQICFGLDELDERPEVSMKPFESVVRDWGDEELLRSKTGYQIE